MIRLCLNHSSFLPSNAGWDASHIYSYEWPRFLAIMSKSTVDSSFENDPLGRSCHVICPLPFDRYLIGSFLSWATWQKTTWEVRCSKTIAKCSFLARSSRMAHSSDFVSTTKLSWMWYKFPKATRPFNWLLHFLLADWLAIVVDNFVFETEIYQISFLHCYDQNQISIKRKVST